MFKVNIASTAVNVKAGISQRTKKEYSMREQIGWVYMFDQQGRPNPHPHSITLILDGDDAPYPVGDYLLSPSSFYVGSFGSVKVRPKLEPLKKPVSVAA